MPKIYTRTGDQGTTGLIKGRISKADPRIEAIGQLDSLNAQVGYLIDITGDYCHNQRLQRCQDLIFTLGSQLADVEGKYDLGGIDQKDITDLEDSIDEMTKELEPLRNFILPRGDPIISWTHVVRTACRTAERACVGIENPPNNLLPYLNRLSDYLFTLARYFAKHLSVEEVIWKGKRSDSKRDDH